jgi:hypothetical protein
MAALVNASLENKKVLSKTSVSSTNMDIDDTSPADFHIRVPSSSSTSGSMLASTRNDAVMTSTPTKRAVDSTGKISSKRRKDMTNSLSARKERLVAASRFLAKEKIDKAIEKKNDAELCKLLVGLNRPGLFSACRNMYIMLWYLSKQEPETLLPCNLETLISRLTVRFVLKNVGLCETQVLRLSKALAEKRRAEFKLSHSDCLFLDIIRDEKVTMKSLFGAEARGDYSDFIEHARFVLRQQIAFLVLIEVLTPVQAQSDTIHTQYFSLVLSSNSNSLRESVDVPYTMNAIPLGCPVYVKSDRDVRRYW